MEWRERITVDTKVLGGKPVVKGTRISVELVLELLADGWSEAQIIQNYDGITVQDIIACQLYAAENPESERSRLLYHSAPFGVLSDSLTERRQCLARFGDQDVYGHIHEGLSEAVRVYQQKFSLFSYQMTRTLTAYDELLASWPSPENWLKPDGLSGVGRTLSNLQYEITFALMSLMILYHALCPIALRSLGPPGEAFLCEEKFPFFSGCMDKFSKFQKCASREITAAFCKTDTFNEFSCMRNQLVHRDIQAFVGMDHDCGPVFTTVPIVPKAPGGQQVIGRVIAAPPPNAGKIKKAKGKRPKSDEMKPILPAMRRYIRAHLEAAFRIESYALSLAHIEPLEPVRSGLIIATDEVLVRLCDPNTNTFDVEKHIESQV